MCNLTLQLLKPPFRLYDITEPRSLTLQVDSLSAEPPGKPQNTEGLSLLQRIFLTQESNRGLLHCRQILYQLSYQGSPLNNLSTSFIMGILKVI